MTIKARGRAALILAAGFFVWFAGPSQAVADDDDGAISAETAAGPPIALNRYTNTGPHHHRVHAHARSSKAALKSSAGTKAAEIAADKSSAISPSVANANAQLNGTETPAAGDGAMSARADDARQDAANNAMTAPPAKSQTVSADQLTDTDRTLQENKPIAAAFAMATTGAPATTGGNERSTWDRTSLIGKIFIGFGVLLTMASAARMFIA